MNHPDFVPLPPLKQFSELESIDRAGDFYQLLKQRRTVREFSRKPIPRQVLEKCLLAAGTAPNGANLQPWHFCVVQDPEIRKRIRLEAEMEEREFYQNRAPQDWLDALAPLGTDENKPFLEEAGALIVIFSQSHRIKEDGSIMKHYYAGESVGIATGMLITALHVCGLASLTHTPSPMKFLNKILGRPSFERPFLILVAGYPAENAMIPNITKKPLNEIASFV